VADTLAPVRMPDGSWVYAPVTAIGDNKYRYEPRTTPLALPQVDFEPLDVNAPAPTDPAVSTPEGAIEYANAMSGALAGDLSDVWQSLEEFDRNLPNVDVSPPEDHWYDVVGDAISSFAHGAADAIYSSAHDFVWGDPRSGHSTIENYMESWSPKNQEKIEWLAKNNPARLYWYKSHGFKTEDLYRDHTAQDEISDFPVVGSLFSMFATGARAREQFDAGNIRAAVNTLSYGVGSAAPGFVVQYALGKLGRKLAREAQASDLIPYSEVPITAKDANYRPLMLGPGEPQGSNPYGPISNPAGNARSQPLLLGPGDVSSYRAQAEAAVAEETTTLIKHDETHGVALARAVSPSQGFIGPSYVNFFPYDPDSSLPGAVHFPSELSNNLFRITDKELYIESLREVYAKSGTPLHSEIEGNIRDHIGDGTLLVGKGLPGTHAEVRAQNWALSNGYDSDGLTIYTYRLVQGSGQGGPFVACDNCSHAISPSVNVPTGRTEIPPWSMKPWWEF